MSEDPRKDYWFHRAVEPPLHICVAYNTAVYLKYRRNAKQAAHREDER